jgi:hypothetical protein
MILTGVIESIFPEESRNNFRWTTIWLQQQYANQGSRASVWEIKFFNDEAAWLKRFKTGDLVNVNVDIIGKKATYQGKETVFTTIRAVKIEKLK